MNKYKVKAATGTDMETVMRFSDQTLNGQGFPPWMCEGIPAFR